MSKYIIFRNCVRREDPRQVVSFSQYAGRQIYENCNVPQTVNLYYECMFKEGVVSCIQLEDPCLPLIFSFSKVFQVVLLGQRAEGRYDLVAVLATASYE